MAVGVSELTHSITNVGGGGFPSVADRRRPKFMPPSDMSFQQPLPPLDSPEMATNQSGYPSSYDISTQQGPSSLGGDPNWTLQRSFSNPDVAGPGHHNAEPLQSGAAGEKKRNKLGYHRTSVACSHCRRRKIRCIPSTSDTQGRCANCIRLKKECSFIPTEQQQGSDARPRGAGQPQSDSRAPSKSLSPGPAGSSTGSKPSPRQFAPLTANVASMPPPPMNGNPNGDGPLASINGPGQIYDGGQNVSGWMPTGIQPFLETTSTNWNNPWRGRPTQSPISEQSTEPTLSTAWAPAVSDSASRDMAWGSQMSVPVRSFSYSGESMNGASTGPYIPIGHGGPAGRQPYVNQSMSMAAMGDGYQSGMDSDGPISPVHLSHQAAMQWQQQQQHENFVRSQTGFAPWAPGQGGPGPQAQLDSAGQPVSSDEASGAAIDGTH